MTETLRAKLDRGATVAGMINFIGHPMAIEVMARAGLDFAMTDMEHCPLDLQDLSHIVRAADAFGIAPLVRVPDVDPPLIKRVLNLGVQGLVIPHANRERCERLIEAALYAPDGKRGACPVVRATRYWPENWAEHARQINRDLFIMPLIEDVEAIDGFADIARLPGIPAYFVGPYDLSVSIGLPGASFKHPQMREALDVVLGQARQYGKHVFTTVGDIQEGEYARMLVAAGVRGLIFATDILVLLQSCQRLVSATKSWFQDDAHGCIGGR